MFMVVALCILWSRLKNRTPQDLTIANFRHTVSKSWVRPWAARFTGNFNYGKLLAQRAVKLVFLVASLVLKLPRTKFFLL